MNVRKMKMLATALKSEVSAMIRTLDADKIDELKALTHAETVEWYGMMMRDAHQEKEEKPKP